jgi:hypothetical protein
MRYGIKLPLAALIVGLAFTASTPAATASRALRPLTLETVLSSSEVTFRTALVEIICVSRMSVSFHGDIVKTRGTLAGFITEASITGCVESVFGRAVRVRPLLLWHIRYESFAGALPNITSVLFAVNVALLATIPGVFLGQIGCLYAGTVGISTEGNPVTRASTLSPNRLALITTLEREPGGQGCPESGELSASFAVSPTVAILLI